MGDVNITGLEAVLREMEERKAWVSFFGIAVSKVVVIAGMQTINYAAKFADDCMPHYRARFRTDEENKEAKDIPADIASAVAGIGNPDEKSNKKD